MSAYTDETLLQVFSDETRLSTWHAVEVAVLWAQGQTGEIPEQWAIEAAEAGPPSVDAWREAEERTRHEFVAFLEASGIEHIHIGLTSSDVIDTSAAIVLRVANNHLLALAMDLNTDLLTEARKTLGMFRVGRTHGQSAVLDTWGHRLAEFGFMLDRQIDRFVEATKAMCVAMLSGPVGGHLFVSPQVEAIVASVLGLDPVGCSTQIVARDRLAHWAQTTAGLVTVCEAIATEIRLGAHGEVREVYEGRTADQRGSSAMPTKMNPIVAERICGLARLARSQAEPLALGVVQWHDRDLAHSSVERVNVPALCHTTAHALTLTRSLVTGMTASALRMSHNVDEAKQDLYAHEAQSLLQLRGVPYVEAAARVSRMTLPKDLVPLAPDGPKRPDLRVVSQMLDYLLANDYSTPKEHDESQ